MQKRNSDYITAEVQQQKEEAKKKTLFRKDENL